MSDVADLEELIVVVGLVEMLLKALERPSAARLAETAVPQLVPQLVALRERAIAATSPGAAEPDRG